MAQESPDLVDIAGRLRLVMSALLRRVRDVRSFPLTQAAVLHTLDREGAMSIGDLARDQRVRPQSMAQVVGELEQGGFVDRAPDSTDRRRVLISITPTGDAALVDERRERDGWLAAQLGDACTPEQLEALATALPALERVTDRT
jgi:DNA-binding MarR family transcriptional regulator